MTDTISGKAKALTEMVYGKTEDCSSRAYFDDCVKAIQAALHHERDAALEEAAMECDKESENVWMMIDEVSSKNARAHACALRIRSLKPTRKGDSDEDV